MPGLETEVTPVTALPGVADAARLAVLDRTGLRPGVQDDALDQVSRLASALLHAPAAYVTLVGIDEWFAPGAFEQDRPSDPVRRMAASDSLCQFQVVTEEPLVVPDTRKDPLTQHKAGVLDGSTAAYAGVPLRLASGHVLGSLCVNDRQPRAWTPEQLDLLKDLAAVVSRDVEQRLAARRSEELQASARQLTQEVPALLDAVDGLVELAEQQDEQPRLQRYAALARSRSQRVQALTATLTAAPAPGAGPAEIVVELGRAVQAAVVSARAATGTSAIELAPLPEGPLPVRCDPDALQRALVHLLVSALHHTGHGEALRVTLTTSGGDEAGASRAELTLSALGTQIPAAELGRIVSRFTQASSSAGQVAPSGGAAFRMVGGEVHTRSGQVSGRSSRHGLAFQVRWDLQAEQGPVIDLR